MGKDPTAQGQRAHLASEVACDGCERLPRHPVGPLLKPVCPRAQVEGRALGTASWCLSRPVRHDSYVAEPGAVPFPR